MPKKEWSTKQISLLFFACCILIFFWCNLLPPVSGMGNADYFQIASGGFLLNSENGCQTSFSSIAYDTSYHGSMNWILRPLSKMVSVLDVRLLSSVYFLAVLMSFGLFFVTFQPEKQWYRLLLSAVCIFVFCDFAYLLHLNSLNPEGAFYCIVLVMVSLLLLQFYKKTTILRCAIYMALALLAAGLKNGYFWLGIAFSVMMLPTFYIRKDLFYRVLTIALAVAVSIGSLVMFGNGVSDAKTKQDLFHSIYYGILKEDAQAAQKLGLPEDAKQYAQKTCYDVDTSVLDDSRYMVGYPTVLKYYLTNPAKLLKKMEISADNAYEIRQLYVSNSPAEFKIRYGFHLYSAMKRRLIQPDFWLVLAVIGGVIAFCVIHLKKETNAPKKAHYLFVILLSATTFMCFCTPVILSGEAALSANLFLYNLFFDILLIHIIAGATSALVKRREEIQKKYGVRQ